MNVLAVVAHHDDHLLWMGGTLQRMTLLGWNWTLIALCVPAPDRQRFFCDYCCALGISDASYSQFQDYQDRQPFSSNSKDAMRAEVQRAVSGKTFDRIFTHSRDPQREYGHHSNHVEVEAVVTSLVQDGIVGRGGGSVAYFCYSAIYGGGGRATTARLDASYYLPLLYDELLFKAAWCKKVPDPGKFEKLGFSCPSPEAFEGDNLTLLPPFVAHD
jgi:LmbE family N-acetylglucosaminyl deacetylase